MQIWALRNFKEIDLLNDAIKDYDGPLRVDLTLVFHKPRIIKKDGGIKLGRNDNTNFVKCVFDKLAQLMNTDDARFNESLIKRVTCENESDQQVIISITKCEIGNYDSQR